MRGRRARCRRTQQSPAARRARRQRVGEGATGDDADLVQVRSTLPAECAPSFGDRSSYQMDPANAEEGIREALTDVAEGADLLLVKPAVPYLDVLWRVKQATGLPLAAYHVSGEYAMVHAAAQRGWIDGDKVMAETILSIRRAGADLVITYAALWMARRLQG